MPEAPRAPQFPVSSIEEAAYGAARRARWDGARARHAQADEWQGALTGAGTPDFLAEALEEALDGGNYVAAERVAPGSDPPFIAWAVARVHLDVAALCFEIAWLALRAYRSSDAPPSLAGPMLALLHQLRDRYAVVPRGGSS